MPGLYKAVKKKKTSRAHPRGLEWTVILVRVKSIPDRQPGSGHSPALPCRLGCTRLRLLIHGLGSQLPRACCLPGAQLLTTGPPITTFPPRHPSEVGAVSPRRALQPRDCRNLPRGARTASNHRQGGAAHGEAPPQAAPAPWHSWGLYWA